MNEFTEQPSRHPVKNKTLVRTGELLGRHVLKPGLDRLRAKVELIGVNTSGLENLGSLTGRPFLLVSNHIKPESAVAEQSALGPDAFIIENIVKKVTDQQVGIIAKSDDGWWADNRLYRSFQKRVHQPFGQALVKGADLIPVKKNPGSVNLDFIRTTRAAVARGHAILIFPEGTWYEDFDTSHPLSHGAAGLALSLDLPIVPTYIRGCKSWEKDQNVDLAFGLPFEAAGRSKDDITEEIRTSLHALQQIVVSKHGES